MRYYFRIFSIICFILSTVCFILSEALALEKYMLIKSMNLQQMEDVINGFKESLPIAPVFIYDMEGKANEKKIQEIITSEKPSVIITLGTLASESVVKIEKKIPVLFAMVINYKQYDFLRQNNVTGISMEIPPANLFTQLKMLVPEMDSVGVPYSSSFLSESLNEAFEASKLMGIKLVPFVVKNPQDITKDLTRKEQQFKGLWMIADTKLYNISTNAVLDLILFAKAKKKPLLVFSEAFLSRGAFFSLSINYKSLGSQLAVMVKLLVQEKRPLTELRIESPIGTYSVINKEIAKFLMGEKFDETMLEGLDKVYVNEKSNE
ncbi:MAG: hypothetical protein HQK76_07690 [Desulfobacterales bacterium]|nr:hypothetical protein [Desulfobacterales bacterium]